MFFPNADAILGFVQKWSFYNWAKVEQTAPNGSPKHFFIATASLANLPQKFPANTTVVLSLVTEKNQEFNSLSVPRYNAAGAVIGQVEFYYLSPLEALQLKFLQPAAHVAALNNNQVLDVQGNVLTQVMHAPGVGYL